MTAEEWALAASAFFSGLGAGLLGMLCTILRPMQAAMTGQEFRDFMTERGFGMRWAGPAEFATFMAESDVRMGEAMRLLGLAR